MFTGIVEEVGTIDTISRGANSAVLTIRAEKVLDGTNVGDSIAVNGICLTVTRLMPHAFTADVMHETLNRSSLANAMRGAHVNLERAMAADGRFGGHIVSGHVDGTGRIVEVKKDDNAIWYTIQAAPQLMRLSLIHILKRLKRLSVHVLQSTLQLSQALSTMQKRMVSTAYGSTR